MGSASIPLQVKPAEFKSPLQSVGGIMALRGQMSDLALRGQQLKQAEQQTQLIDAEQKQKNLDLADQNLVMESLKDPAIAAKLHVGDFTSIESRIQPKTLDVLRTNQLKHEQELATNTAAQNGLRATALGEITDTAVGLKSLVGADGKPDLAKINEALPSAVQRLKSVGAFKNAGITQEPPTSINDLSQLDQFLSSIGGAKSVTDKVLAQQKEKSATEASQAATKHSTVQADEGQFKLDLMKGALGGNEDQVIDQRFSGNPEAAQLAKTIYREHLKTGDIAKALSAVDDLYTERIGAAKKIASETPAKVAEQAAMLPGEVRKAGAVSQAEIPARVAGAVQTQQALAKLSPDAFATVPDATSRHAAMNEYDKVAQAYTDKLATTQQLIDSISLAQKGNKAAPGVIPLAELRGFVNRVNTAELNAVSTNAGSLLDRLQGHINKATEGQPIPPDILKDMKVLATLQTQAAKRGYDSGLQRLKTRGVDVSKIETPTISGGDVQSIRARDPQGKLHEAPAGTALPAGWKLEP